MSVSYTLRMPDDLKRLIDMAARKGGWSTAQFIVEACWKHLDTSKTSSVLVPQPPTMSDPPHHAAEEPAQEDVPATVMCSYREYDPDTGETMKCGLTAHSPKRKHAEWSKL